MSTSRADTLAPFDEVVLAARALLVDRVTAARADIHGVLRVVVCGIDTVTGRNVAVPAPTDTTAVLAA